MKKILLILLSGHIVWADCTQPVSYLTQNTPATCNGYLFTPEKELEVRIKVANYDNLTTINKQQSDLIDVLNQRIQNQVQQNAVLADELQKRQSDSMLQKALYFTLGALLTGLVGYGTIKAYQH